MAASALIAVMGVGSPAPALATLGLAAHGLLPRPAGRALLGLAIAVTLGAALAEAAGAIRPLLPAAQPQALAVWSVGWCVLYALAAALGGWVGEASAGGATVAQGQLDMLARTLDRLAGEHPDTTLGVALAACAEQLQADAGCLLLREPDSERMTLALTLENGRAAAPAVRVEIPSWTELRRSDEPVALLNPADDARAHDPTWLRAQGLHSAIYIPLWRDGAQIGCVGLFRRGRDAWGGSDLVLSQALARQLALLVTLSDLGARAQGAALLEERARMAREIHDTLAQGFTGIVVQLEAAEDTLAEDPQDAVAHLVRAKALARQSLAEARRSVLALRPTHGDAPLPERLAAALAATVAPAGVASTLSCDAVWPLGSEREADLLRIAQEALVNTVRHAGARTVAVQLRASPGAVELTVADDGRGFDIHTPSDGLGLRGMRERAARHGGRLEVASGPGGTRVLAWLPLAGGDR